MDPLKSAWQHAGQTSQANKITLHNPVLKDIRRQLLIETICYTIFLLVYYNFFDGADKSFILNAVLVASVLLLLMNNGMGYLLTRAGKGGADLKTSLSEHLGKLRRYAFVAIVSRALAFAGIMLFFLGNVSWTSRKYITLAVIICILITQIVLLAKVWAARIGKIREVLAGL